MAARTLPRAERQSQRSDEGNGRNDEIAGIPGAWARRHSKRSYFWEVPGGGTLAGTGGDAGTAETGFFVDVLCLEVPTAGSSSGPTTSGASADAAIEALVETGGVKVAAAVGASTGTAEDGETEACGSSRRVVRAPHQ